MSTACDRGTPDAPEPLARPERGASNGVAMRRTRRMGKGKPAQYYDRHGALGEIVEGPVEFSLEEELRAQILEGRRARRLQNISIKPAQAKALTVAPSLHLRGHRVHLLWLSEVWPALPECQAHRVPLPLVARALRYPTKV